MQKQKEITPKQAIRTPLTTEDVRVLTLLCEDLIQRVQMTTAGWASVFAKQSAEDIMDVLIDLKVDLEEWGDREAEVMHEDGFLNPINTGERA
jgi:hypothetical protein